MSEQHPFAPRIWALIDKVRAPRHGQPEWTICTEHRRFIGEDDHGSCPDCQGDRNLIVVVPAGTSSTLIEELAELLEQVTKGYAARMADERAFGRHIMRLSARYARYRLGVWKAKALGRRTP
jgi:hypothetical protein